MSGTTSKTLSGVAETLSITLYIRALESQRPDTLIKDETAVALVTEMDYDFARIKQIKLDEDDKLAVILRTKEFDRYIGELLLRSCFSPRAFSCISSRRKSSRWHPPIGRVVPLRLLGATARSYSLDAPRSIVRPCDGHFSLSVR